MDNGKDRLRVQQEILVALQHPEADEGLYFRNFAHLHEEDERPRVFASDGEIFDALTELVKEGKVRIEENGKDPIFHFES